MATFSVSGLVSGINYDDMIKKIIEVDSQPIILLQRRQADYNKQISVYGDLSAKLAALKTAADSLRTVSSFYTKKASSSDETVFDATAGSSAAAGNYSVTVTALAQAHRVASSIVASEATAVSAVSGNFSFQVGGAAVTTVTVDATTTLVGLRDGINAARGDAEASIIFDGTAYRLILTSRTSGEANIGVLNHLKFDLWTPGNGDFYDGLRNLQARMKQASFPTLAANVIVKSSGQRVGRPFLIEKVGDVQIAFLGLCTLRTNLPSAWPVRLDDPIETAKNFVPQFRKESDVVVAVTHIGYEKDVELAKTVPGIDLIIGGHSHTKLDTGEIVRGPAGKDVLICQAGEHLQYAGRVDLSLKPVGKRFQLVGATARLIPLDEKIKLDAEVTALIAKMSGASSQPATAPSASRPAVRPTTRPAALKPAGTISTGR